MIKLTKEILITLLLTILQTILVYSLFNDYTPLQITFVSTSQYAQLFTFFEFGIGLLSLILLFLLQNSSFYATLTNRVKAAILIIVSALISRVGVKIYSLYIKYSMFTGYVNEKLTTTLLTTSNWIITVKLNLDESQLAVKEYIEKQIIPQLNETSAQFIRSHINDYAITFYNKGAEAATDLIATDVALSTRLVITPKNFWSNFYELITPLKSVVFNFYSDHPYICWGAATTLGIFTISYIFPSQTNYFIDYMYKGVSLAAKHTNEIKRTTEVSCNIDLELKKAIMLNNNTVKHFGDQLLSILEIHSVILAELPRALSECKIVLPNDYLDSWTDLYRKISVLMKELRNNFKTP